MPVWAKAAVAAVLLIPSVRGWSTGRTACRCRTGWPRSPPRSPAARSRCAARACSAACWPPATPRRASSRSTPRAGSATTRTCARPPARSSTPLVDGGRERQLACAERSSSCGDDVQTLAWAIGTVAHESVHLRGILDEALTECYAMQYLASTAQRLGATPQQARNLALLHWETSPAQEAGPVPGAGRLRGRREVRRASRRPGLALRRAGPSPSRSCSRHHATVSASVRLERDLRLPARGGAQPRRRRRAPPSPRARARATGRPGGRARRRRPRASSSSSSRAEVERPEQTL